MKGGKRISLIEGFLVVIVGLCFGILGMFTTLVLGFASQKIRKM